MTPDLSLILKQMDDPQLAAAYELERNDFFDSIAELGAKVVGRNIASLYLEMHDKNYVIGGYNLARKTWPLMQKEVFRNYAFLDVPDARPYMEKIAKEYGKFYQVASMTICEVTCFGKRVGALGVGDSDKVGPLGDADKDALLRVARMASYVIETRSAAQLLRQDLAAILS